MKFGAQLTGYSVLEWRAHNILYNDLKHEIRKVTTCQPSSEDLQNLAAFFDREFENFTLVVKSKTGEIDFRIAKCEELVQQLASDHDQQGKQRFNHEISRLTRDIQHLSRFSKAQYTGFQKLIKKYRKWSNGGTLLDEFEERLGADDSAGRIDLTPRFLELSVLWDMSRDGNFKALGSIRGSADESTASAALDAQVASQPQRLRLWIPKDSVMEVFLTLLPHMRLEGSDQVRTTFFDSESFDYIRNSKQPGQLCQGGKDSWLCAPTGGLRRFTSARLSQSQTQALLDGKLPSLNSSEDVAKKLAIGWIEATKASPFATVHSTRTRYRDERPGSADMMISHKVWAVIDEHISIHTPDGSRAVGFPHAVLEICWTGDTPSFVEEATKSHLVHVPSASFSLFALSALQLYPDVFVGRPSWLKTLEDGTDIRRTVEIPSPSNDKAPQSADSRLHSKRSTILLNANSQPPGLEEDDGDAEASSPSTLRYWNEFDFPEEDGEYAVYIDHEDDGRIGVAEQLSQPIIHLSQKVRRSMYHLRSMFTGESRESSPEPGEESETDRLLPYSPRLAAQEIPHYESFPHSEARVAMRDMIMAMLSCICYVLAGTVTFLAYSIIIGDDGSHLLGTVRSVLIIGLLFGVAFSGLGAAIFNLQTNPSWFGQVTAQAIFFGIVCTGAGGIAWVATT